MLVTVSIRPFYSFGAWHGLVELPGEHQIPLYGLYDIGV